MESSDQMVLNGVLSLIPLFPLIGCIVAYLAGKRVKDAAGWIATAAAASSFAVVCYFTAKLPSRGFIEESVFEWIGVAPLKVDFLLRFDQLTAVMCLIITGIGSLIHLYSIGYMAHDESRPRFFAYLNLFLFSMLLLVLGGNLLVLFVGWEGVGLCSYLLIGFWYRNSAYAAAGRKAFVVNRIGDAGFLLAIFFIFVNFRTLDFHELSLSIGGQEPWLYTIIALLLFIGATGKSAQIPLFVWLPDAMAGPTPVSALIHAATMVTAGVYMLARTHFLYSLSEVALAVVTVVAVLTAFIAATIAICQNDIKKVLAYSTVSQLGFMFMAAGAGAYWVAIFHVVTHAFFKACLFLCAGSVIHGCHDEQDMRRMGGLRAYMPWTCLTYGVSTLAIAGIFPFSGYQSKHAILASLEHMQNSQLSSFTAGLLVWAASVTAVLTAFYMARSFAMTFLGHYRGQGEPHESPMTMVLPLVVLAFLAAIGGYVLTDVFSLQRYLSAVVPAGVPHEHESIVSGILHSIWAIAGVSLGLLMYTKFSELPGRVYKSLGAVGRFFANRYYIDELYGLVVVKPLEFGARVLWKGIDQEIIDGAVNGSAAVVDASGEALRTIQSGQLRHYALLILGAAVVLLLVLLVI